MSGEVTEIKSLDDFKKIIDTPRLVIIDCHAVWCGPCRVIAPSVLQMAKDAINDESDFYKVDVDQVPEVAKLLEVRAMPTFVCFKNGEKIGTVVGANSSALKAFYAQHK